MDERADTLWRLCKHGWAHRHGYVDGPTSSSTAVAICPGGRRVVVDHEAAYKALYRVVAIQGDGLQTGATAAIQAALGKDTA